MVCLPAGRLMEYLPSSLDAVPVCRSGMYTVANGRGLPFSSVINPRTDCATAGIDDKRTMVTSRMCCKWRFISEGIVPVLTVCSEFGFSRLLSAASYFTDGNECTFVNEIRYTRRNCGLTPCIGICIEMSYGSQFEANPTRIKK